MNYNKVPKPNLPELRCYPEEIDLILKVFAMSDTIDEMLVTPSFKRRLDAIPHATTGMKMMGGRMLQLAFDLVATLPDAKKRSISRMAPHMKFKVYHAAPASSLGEDECVIRHEDASLLCKYASHNCDICFDGNCNNCELGKLFDEVMTYDRERNESWATYNWGRNR